MISEEVLIQRAQQGNLTAAEQLFSLYQDRVFSYLWRMTRNRALAEDASQETFIKGIKGLKRYREQGSFKAWLFKIAYREGLRALKKEQRHFWHRFIPGRNTKGDADGNKTLEDSLPGCEPASSFPGSDEAVIVKEEQQMLENALSGLPENERQVVMLRIYEGLSFKEITTIMNCPVNTALGRMHNAVKRLKKTMHKEG